MSKPRSADPVVKMFQALVLDDSEKVSSDYFIQFLKDQGLKLDTDPRLASVNRELKMMGALENNYNFSLYEFAKVVSGAVSLLHKAIEGKLRVPDFNNFKAIFEEVFEIVEQNTSGNNADYIPQLAAVDPDQFAISVTTVDGQQISIGDADKQFCIQSCSKPINYLIAQKEFGSDYVHHHVGTEPSGRKFNEMTLKPKPDEGNPNRAIPHNPMINAGAILTTSMVVPNLESRQERLEHVLQVWRDLSGDVRCTKIGYDDDTYKSESATADRNWCLGYMMKESDAFPSVFKDLDETLQLYFQLCSILATSDSMSVMAATLANGGLNPVTGKRVFNPEHIRNVLPLMLTSGMYDYSGQWAFDIGVPSKSGVGGSVFIVIPNVAGITIWSPRLDEVGNSVRGVHAAKELLKRVAFHNFEVFSGSSMTKVDPCMRLNESQDTVMGDMLFAASLGDVSALNSLKNAGLDFSMSGINFSHGDYDFRTALHLAASNGHYDCVKFLIEAIPADKRVDVINQKDRWGGTPFDDAQRHEHYDCADLLREAGCKAGNASVEDANEDKAYEENINQEAGRGIFAAARGELEYMIQLRARDVDLTLADYDGRTAAHLAASNGYEAILRYLKVQYGAEAVCCPKDRFGNTPIVDSIREGQEGCQRYLESLVVERSESQENNLGSQMVVSPSSEPEGYTRKSIKCENGLQLNLMAKSNKL